MLKYGQLQFEFFIKYMCFFSESWDRYEGENEDDNQNEPHCEDDNFNVRNYFLLKFNNQ